MCQELCQLLYMYPLYSPNNPIRYCSLSFADEVCEIYFHLGCIANKSKMESICLQTPISNAVPLWANKWYLVSVHAPQWARQLLFGMNKLYSLVRKIGKIPRVRWETIRHEELSTKYLSDKCPEFRGGKDWGWEGSGETSELQWMANCPYGLQILMSVCE